MVRKSFILLIAVTVLAGCSRAKREPEYRITSSEKEQGSALGRVFGTTTVPLYGWDGQYSVATLDGSMDLLFGQTIEVLQKMNFNLRTDETRRRENTASIEAIRQDRTAASVRMVPGKSPATTEIRVRIGTVGDRAGSERVLDEIVSSLRPKKKTVPPPSQPQR
ncbi:MAG TPA: DUF3568 family protein [Planctomycetota bacterium]|nr:DUF3568 family protein [Planctomycetota bacterium]